MPVQNRIPLSVRIDQEEADFIAQLHVEGANTPSEKIREILKQARMAHQQTHDYNSALTAMEQFVQNAKRDVLRAEKNLAVHSHILMRLFELVPDLTATLAQDLPDDADLLTLKHYEREMMFRVVRLMDSILQLAVVGKGAAYDDDVLAQLGNTLKLAAIVSAHRQAHID